MDKLWEDDLFSAPQIIAEQFQELTEDRRKYLASLIEEAMTECSLLVSSVTLES